MWMEVLSVENVDHRQSLGVTRVRPKALGCSWHLDSKILRITLGYFGPRKVRSKVKSK